MLFKKGTLAQELLDETLDEAELNLAPIMNLFVILIPFLLLSASFVNYSTIDTPAPTQKTAVVTKQKPSPNLTVTVAPERWILDVQSPKGSTRRYRFKAGDYAKLLLRLEKVKKRYPRHTTVFLKSGRGVKYSEVIAMIDAVRGHTPKSLNIEKKELFTEVVFGDIY